MPLDFGPLSLDLQEKYMERLQASRTNASDYSFANIWGWAEEYGLQWAWETDLVWIRQTRPEKRLWAPVGPWASVDWSRRLLPHLDGGAKMIRVPEALKTRFQSVLGDRIRSEDAREHWDYLYRVDELVALKGNRFHKKKNLLKQFQKKYDYRFQPMSPEIIDMALEMQEEWCLWRDCEASETLAAENRAITRVFQHWKTLTHLIGGALMVEETPVAYTVAEALTDDTLVIHFEKGCTGFKGVYQAVNQLFLENEADGFTLVNREQDLGDQGLRKAKESYNPVDYVKKYTVSFR
ncbi:MAG: phosphatidylglycerol lysyltransferase domain-containing protein [Desulfobacterales bacterium]|nr:phosphatidylglycerol lysyltransferase domain-containing protein [Desulfobacterales bacterium]